MKKKRKVSRKDTLLLTVGHINALDARWGRGEGGKNLPERESLKRMTRLDTDNLVASMGGMLRISRFFLLLLFLLSFPPSSILGWAHTQFIH